MSEHLDAVRAALKGRYAVEREIGSGGMATVFLAQDVKHSRQVAVKVLRPELVKLLGTERFLREIEIAATLQHPHILPLHDSGEADGFLFYVMPFVQGESLRERLERDGHLPWREAVEITREIASALDYAHAQNVVHRDIKPENILLSQGHAVVADFGIAAALGADDESRATQMGFALGTPAYMSPEQAATDPDIDGRADTYSLGCVLYEMISGSPPFHGTNARAVMASAAVSKAPGIERTGNQGVPGAVNRAVMRSIEKDPARRFPSAGEFRRALDQDATVSVGPARATGLYLVLAVALLGVTYFATEQFGLPYWGLFTAVILVAVGFPIVAFTAAAEQGLGPPRLGFLSWRRTSRIVYAGVAVILAGVSVDAALRIAGIGPAGHLVAAGVLDNRERILLADFGGSSDDSTLAAAATEAFRIDLSQSPIVTLVERDFVNRVLARMQTPPGAKITESVAREVAQRAGVKAVMTGELNSVGPGFVVSARLVSAEDGSVLAAYREDASSAEGLIRSIDRLSRRMRERIGESLTSIRRGERLSEVTTSSLEALRKYSQGGRIAETGDLMTARNLMSEAIELDSSFAMAYRALGLLTFSRSEQVRMLEMAFRHRDRLPDQERYLAEASYYSTVLGQPEDAISAYRSLLATYPDNRVALGNLAGEYIARGDAAEALPLARAAIATDTLRVGPYAILARAQVALGDLAGADSTVALMERRLPDNPLVGLNKSLVRVAARDFDGARETLDSLLAGNVDNRVVALSVESQLALLSYTRGRLAAGDRYLASALDGAEDLGLGLSALGSTILKSIVDVWFRGAPDYGLVEIPAALERFPMEQQDPLDRPYLQIAQFYALAGMPDSARGMLADFEGAVQPDLRRALEPARHGIQGMVAMAEEDYPAAVIEFEQASLPVCPTCFLPFVARAYDLGGQTDSAIDAYQRYLDTASLTGFAVDWTWLGRTYYRLGQLYEERGDTALSIANYGNLVDLWQEADDVLQPVASDARNAIARLTAEPSR